MSIIFECSDTDYPEYIRLVTMLNDNFTSFGYKSYIVMEPVFSYNGKKTVIAACVVTDIYCFINSAIIGYFTTDVTKLGYNVKMDHLHDEVLFTLTHSTGESFFIRAISDVETVEYQFEHYSNLHSTLSVPETVTLTSKTMRDLTNRTFIMLKAYSSLNRKITVDENIRSEILLLNSLIYGVV